MVWGKAMKHNDGNSANAASDQYSLPNTFRTQNIIISQMPSKIKPLSLSSNQSHRVQFFSPLGSPSTISKIIFCNLF